MSRIFIRFLVIAGLVLAPMVATAQTPPQPARPSQAPQAARPAQPPRPAQEPQAEQPRPQAAPRPLLSLPGQALNVRIEVTITDQRSGEAPIQKTVALVLADRTNGMVRSETTLPRRPSVPLHVDAEAALVQQDRILVQIGLEYNLPNVAAVEDQTSAQTPWLAQVRESIRAILDDGKPLIVSESADPVTDRKVKVEVKATILR